MLDGLEDQRPLVRIERNFKNRLKEHLLNLIEAKRIYWRQRATIRWVRFGDENTKLYQAIGIQNFRCNYITYIHHHDGTIASNHAQGGFTLDFI